MSFPKAKRFVYSTSSVQSDETPNLKNNDNSVKLYKELRCRSLPTNKQNTSTGTRPRAYTFTKDKNASKNLSNIKEHKEITDDNTTSSEDVSLNDSFSSCLSSHISFHDAHSNITNITSNSIDEIEVHSRVNNQFINIGNMGNTKQRKNSRNCHDKQSKNSEVSTYFMEIKNLLTNISNNVGKNKKLKTLLADIRKSQESLLETMNQKYLYILSNLKKTLTESVKEDLKSLRNENRILENVSKRLSIELEKSREKLEDKNNFYKNRLRRAEKRIGDLELTVEILKEEVNALRLQEQLQHIVRTQEK